MELDMTKGRPMSVLLKFALPLMAGNVFQQFYNMADTIIVGRFVGADALAAVGATGIIMFLLTGFAQGITSGFSILTSQRYGAGDINGVRRSVAGGVILSVASAVVLTLLSLMSMKPLLHFMNTPADIFREAYTYIMVISAGVVTGIFYNLFSAFLRAVGNSRVPLFFLIFSSCLNIVLDLTFILCFDMGTRGAALATVVAQAVSAILCGGYIYMKVPFLTPSAGMWKLNRHDTGLQLSMGIPMGFQFAITAFGGIVMQSAINLFGTVAVAAYTAAGKLESLAEQGMVAIGQAVAVYGGQNFGKGDYKRIREGVRAALVAETTYGILAALCMCGILEPALRIFFAGEVELSAMVPWAWTYTRICTAFFIPLSAIFVFRNIMQGCGYGFLPMAGGIVEMAARLLMAFAAIEMKSYAAACFCHPAAWTSAAVFLGAAYLWIMLRR